MLSWTTSFLVHLLPVAALDIDMDLLWCILVILILTNVNQRTNSYYKWPVNLQSISRNKVTVNEFAVGIRNINRYS